MVVLVESTPSLIHHIMLHHHTLDVEVNYLHVFPHVYRIFLTFERLMSFCTFRPIKLWIKRSECLLKYFDLSWLSAHEVKRVLTKRKNITVQWIFDLRKFLRTAKNFLKSKIFLKSNTPSSLKYANWKYYIYFYDPIY